MSDIPGDLRYSEEHEYVKQSGGGVVTIGITDHAQGELGDVVYIDLPAVGTTLGKTEEFGQIEAVKAVSELFSPLAGEVIEINEALDGDPRLVNQDPYGAGWMIKVRASDTGAVDPLMSPAGYAQHIGE